MLINTIFLAMKNGKTITIYCSEGDLVTIDAPIIGNSYACIMWPNRKHDRVLIDDLPEFVRRVNRRHIGDISLIVK